MVLAPARRRARLNAMQADFATLQALQSNEIPRYQRLKRLIASRRIRSFLVLRFLTRKASKEQEISSSASSNKGGGGLASNSLFVSTLPSSVGDGGANSIRESFVFLDDDDEEEDNDEEDGIPKVEENGENIGRRKRNTQTGDETLLLDLTSATNLTTSIGSLLRRSADSDMESTIASFSENPLQPAFKIAATQYASVDASRLADLQNKIISRASRRNGGLSEGDYRSTELAKFLESSGANIDKVKELRDQLEKLRDKSDALIRKHLRPPILSQQQRNQSSSASEVLHARRKKLGDRTEAYMTRLLNPGKPKDVLEKSRNAPISSISTQILKQVPVDLRLSQASDTLLSSDDDSTIAKDQLLKGPRLPADFVHALDQVRFPNSKSDQAITSHKLACIALDRSRRWWSVYDPELGRSADLREIAPAPDGWPDLIQSSAPQGGEPGHKAFSALGYLPPKLKDSVPRITPHIHAQDLMSNVLDKPETSGVAPVIPSIYSFESGPDAKRIMPIQVVSSKDASDWWISAACASSPFFSHVSTGTNSTTKPSYVFGGALLDSNLESNRSDMSLESAMKNLGVIDAWSTAAAYIDPTAVQQEARASSAAAAAALISSDLNEANVATESSSSSAIATQSIEDLLSLSFELQAAPPFDFYGTALNTRTLSSGMGLISTDTGIPSRTNLATPSLAAPAESVSSRVTSLFEALKRRLETEDGGNILGPDGTPISSSQLARNVAARTIQHFIRGRKFVQSAKHILAQKRENSAVFAKQKLNVIQTAMAQFIEALQSAGVVTGDDETAMTLAETARRAITSSNGMASTLSKQNLTSSHLPSSSKIPIVKRPGSAPDTSTGAPHVQPYLRYQRPVTSSGRK
jgi:hypothetical protein